MMSSAGKSGPSTSGRSKTGDEKDDLDEYLEGMFP